MKTTMDSLPDAPVYRPSHVRKRKLGLPGKSAGQFGCSFQVRVITDNDVVRPCGKISGNVEIETRYPIFHLGFMVQFEAFCSLRYSSKCDNQTPFHNGRKMILDGPNVVGNYTYLEPPIQHIISPFKHGLVTADATAILPGLNRYQFSLPIPENPNLPAGFSNEFGSLVYRVAVYMKTVKGYQVAVEVGEKAMRFEGHCNLRNFALTPISIDRFYMKSIFSRKKVVEARLFVQSSGFLRGESVPFTIEYKNPKYYPLKIFVRLVQNLKYNATNKSSALKLQSDILDEVCKQVESDWTPEGVWVNTLHIPDNQEPSYDGHFMYSVTYALQFAIEIVLEIGQADMEGEAPIYIGTTRDDVETLSLLEGMSNLQIPHRAVRRRGSEASLNTLASAGSLRLTGGMSNLHNPHRPVRRRGSEASINTLASVGSFSLTGGMSHLHIPFGASNRRGSNASLNTIASVRSLPPSYSQLSSRAASLETLPPAYEELEFLAEDLVSEVPSITIDPKLNTLSNAGKK